MDTKPKQYYVHQEKTLKKKDFEKLGIPIIQDSFDCSSIANRKNAVMDELKHIPSNTNSYDVIRNDKEVNKKVNDLSVNVAQSFKKWRSKVKDRRFPSPMIIKDLNEKSCLECKYQKRIQEKADQEEKLETVVEQRPIQKIIVNSKQLNSVKQTKSHIKEQFHHTPTVAQKVVLINQKEGCATSKLEFYKIFSLMVNGSKMSQEAVHDEKINLDALEDGEWEVEYPDFLWLELQAWHAGKSVKEQDYFLTEARNSIDTVLDEVVNYQFKWDEVKIPPSNLGKEGSNNLHERVSAISSILHLLQKVEDVEKLYPSLNALSTAHLKYKDVKFTQNLDALVLWLNVNKDIFHVVYRLANWIMIDPNDRLTWSDWFQNGLALNCMKTNQCFEDKQHLSNGDSTYSEMNFIQNVLLAKGKRRTLLEEENKLELKQTSTSRYRSFVERALRDGGLNKLMSNLNPLYGFTLEKINLSFLQGIYFYSQNKNKLRDHASGDGFYSQLLKLFQCFKETFDSSFIYQDEIDEKKEKMGKLRYLSKTQWIKICNDMQLPSLLEPYIFLVGILSDLTHECIRFRLENKLKVEPSNHSIKRLLMESKEVLLGSVICRIYFSMCIQGNSRVENAFERKKEEYCTDINSILNLYFDHLKLWFKMLPQHKFVNSSLKTGLEEEWKFLKDISVFIKDAELKSGSKICELTSNMIKAIGERIQETENTSHNNCNEMACFDRVRSLRICNQYKDMYKEIKEMSLQALTFAKLLQKYLGVAANYDIKTNQEAVLKILKDTDYIKVDLNKTDGYHMFVSHWLSTQPKLILDMMHLNLSSCANSIDETNSTAAYIILVKNNNMPITWKGESCQSENMSELRSVLSLIEQDKDIIVVCNNSYHLKTSCNYIESIFDKSIQVVNHQTSSNDVIGKSLSDIKASTLSLAEVAVETIKQLLTRIDTSKWLMDEADKNLMKKNVIEVFHCYFSFGFEFLREVVRLFHGNSRVNVVPYILTCAKLWMEFVMTKTERGRGTRPRWASQGLEFLLFSIGPSNIEYIRFSEFKLLQSSMKDCLAHIIGDSDAKQKREKYNFKEKRVTKSYIQRSRSFPTFHKPESPFENHPRNLSLPIEFKESQNSSFDSVSVTPEEVTTPMSSISQDSDSGFFSSPSVTSDSIIIEEEDEEEEDIEEIPIIRVHKALQEIDELRTTKLQHIRVIGNVTSKKPDFASDLVHLTVRRVNFKWQLGNKIGEGQFGKVYSSVNLDTGELMAVKQIRFNPHDYGTIQDIADEITNIQGVQHDSLVKYFGVELHKDEMLIFMEFCADGTIAEISKLDLPESIIRVYTHQITKAINFLHENGIIHRDIKGANIFVSSSGLIKIGDFGSAVKLNDAVATTKGEIFSTRGTAAYMAPEVITLDKGKGYGRAADIWSLGCVIVEMTTGKQPWVEFDNIYAIMFKVGDGQHPPIPERLSEEGEHFLKSCFVHDQRYRWTAHMLEDHPFVKCCYPTEE